MTVVLTQKSDIINNIEAKPFVQGARGATGHDLKTAMATIEAAANVLDTINDTILILPLPSDARLTSLVMFNDDLDSNGAPALVVHLGGYYGGDVPGRTSGSLIDADNIASSITTLQAANTLGVELLYEQNDIANVLRPLWQVLGLTSNPGGTIYIGLRVVTPAATAAAGTITLRATYV